MHKLSKFKLIGGWCGSFLELNKISTGQSHIFFLLFFDNKKSFCDLSHPKSVASLIRMVVPVQITLSSHFQPSPPPVVAPLAVRDKCSLAPLSSDLWPLPSMYDLEFWPPDEAQKKRESRTGWWTSCSRAAGTWGGALCGWCVKSGSFSSVAVMGFQMSRKLGNASSQLLLITHLRILALPLGISGSSWGHSALLMREGSSTSVHTSLSLLPLRPF